MRQREFRIPSPCETLAFIKLTWLPQSRGSQYPPVPLPVSSVHHASCYLFHPPLALHSACIITNDNGVTRPDTSLFSTLSSCTGVRLSFLCARLFLLSVSLFVGANGDKETDCPAFVCRGERRADQHGTNCFPPSPVNYVRYAFIIKVYQLGARWLCQMSSPITSSVRPRGLNTPTYLRLSSSVPFPASTHQHQSRSGWVGHRLGNWLSGLTSYLFISFLTLTQKSCGIKQSRFIWVRLRFALIT